MGPLRLIPSLGKKRRLTLSSYQNFDFNPLTERLESKLLVALRHFIVLTLQPDPSQYSSRLFRDVSTVLKLGRHNYFPGQFLGFHNDARGHRGIHCIF
jgi:hypothetical protein